VAKKKTITSATKGANEGIDTHDQEADAICITKFHCMVPVAYDLPFL
jgi:hypothetical protein